MAKIVKANRAQVRAAKAIVERASRGIGQASPAVRAIANAEPVRHADQPEPVTTPRGTHD